MKEKIFALLFILSSVAIAQETPNKIILEDIAAVVGGEIIFSSDIKVVVLQQAQETGITIADSSALYNLSKQVLESEVQKKILLHHAKEAKVEVTDDEVSQMVNNQLSDLRKRYPSEEAFARDVEAAGHTIAGLRENFREQAREDILRQSFLRENSHEFPRVKVSEEEARAFFDSQPVGNSPEQIRFQHMLIAPQPGEEVLAKAKSRIDSIYKVYLGGADFGRLAERNSDGPSAPRGGDLGFFSKGDMVKEFGTAAFSMRVGEVRMVKTKYGWHLIRVEARRQKEVRARHILAGTAIKDEDWERAFTLAKRVRQQVIEGESFYKLGKEYSDDSSEQQQSPPLMMLESIDPKIQQALNGPLEQLPDTNHRISQPIELKPGGYLLVLELERKKAAPLQFEEVRQQIIERLQQSKSIEAYVEQLRQKTYIDIRFKGWIPGAGGF